CVSAGSLVFKVSLNTTYPSGFNAINSRKIGGFHTLCADAGTISEHALTGYLNKDILPASIWDLKHRPRCNSPAGMRYVSGINLWVDIYQPSGITVAGGEYSSGSPVSVYGGTILDTMNWMAAVEIAAMAGKRLMYDYEFQIAAAGANEETNIAGSADPVTTGGHVDTAGRRMISNTGGEDECGVMWQWLLDQSYRFDGATAHTHGVTVSGDPETVTSGNPSGDVAPGWSWADLPGGKGSLLMQGSSGDVKLLAGGSWNSGAYCGSRSRYAGGYRWSANTYFGARFAAEPV
ncbi:MAG: hypothetical protein Q8M56_01440, partial [Desulfobacterales bacterium]|nr:hypothetical protein [Desulfobacterales bacterium]